MYLFLFINNLDLYVNLLDDYDNKYYIDSWFIVWGYFIVFFIYLIKYVRLIYFGLYLVIIILFDEIDVLIGLLMIVLFWFCNISNLMVYYCYCFYLWLHCSLMFKRDNWDVICYVIIV